MELELENKVVVIMGGTSGVGLETANEFLKEGTKVTICGRSQDKLNQAKYYLKNYATDSNLFTGVCDVTNKQQINKFIENVAKKFKTINVLVNAAGRSVMGHFFDITDEQWQEQLNLKYFAIIHAVQAVHPYMKKEGFGRIININATSANELATDNNLVNSVSITVIRTDQCERRRKR